MKHTVELTTTQLCTLSMALKDRWAQQFEYSPSDYQAMEMRLTQELLDLFAPIIKAAHATVPPTTDEILDRLVEDGLMTVVEEGS